MTSNTADSLARRRAPAALVVLLLHLGLFGAASLAMLQSRSSAGRGPAAAVPVAWLRLVPALPAPQAAQLNGPAVPPAAARRPPPVPRERPPSALNWVPASRAAPVAPVAPVSPLSPAAPATPPTELPPPIVADSPPTPAPEASRPLVLTLPRVPSRGASAPWRNPALDDPRSNTRQASLESRLAAVMASSEGPITQEHMPDGSVMFRRGKSCAIVRPSRAGALDPFNQSVSPKPRQVDSC